MWEDPIVAEVHRIRQELSVRLNHDLPAMLADMRKRQTALGSRLVSLATPAQSLSLPTDSSGEEAPTADSSPIRPA